LSRPRLAQVEDEDVARHREGHAGLLEVEDDEARCRSQAGHPLADGRREVADGFGDVAFDEGYEQQQKENRDAGCDANTPADTPCGFYADLFTAVQVRTEHHGRRSARITPALS
jgi:hypothetical protein